MFDSSYIENTRSSVIKSICKTLEIQESSVHGFKNIKHNGNYLHFQFKVGDITYEYDDRTAISIEKKI